VAFVVPILPYAAINLIGLIRMASSGARNRTVDRASLRRIRRQTSVSCPPRQTRGSSSATTFSGGLRRSHPPAGSWSRGRRASVAWRGGIVIHPSAGPASAPKVGRAFALDVDERRGQIVNTAFVRKARKVRRAGRTARLPRGNRNSDGGAFKLIQSRRPERSTRLANVPEVAAARSCGSA
jgi:hypothetical protein